MNGKNYSKTNAAKKKVRELMRFIITLVWGVVHLFLANQLFPVNHFECLGLSYLLQDELLGLDSCWASSRIFSMSPLWIEEEEGTCSSPPVRTSSSSCTASRACEAWDSPWFPFPSSEGKLVFCCWVFPFNSSSTQDPKKPKQSLASAPAFKWALFYLSL